MHRCHVDPAQWNESEMFISNEEEHHLLDVMRVGIGEKVAVFDGQGREAIAEVKRWRPDAGDRVRGRAGVISSAPKPGAGEIEKRRVVLKPLKMKSDMRPDVEITLIQAIPKGGSMDAIVDKATELGASAIWPVITERTVVRLDEKQRVERAQRWQRVALSASRQCRTSWTPRVEPAASFADAMKRAAQLDFLIVGVLEKSATPLRDALTEAKKNLGRGAPGSDSARYRSGESASLIGRGCSIGVIIGPEGDLTPDEVRAAIGAGAKGVSFGPLVLRVETAAVFALSAFLYEFSGCLSKS